MDFVFGCRVLTTSVLLFVGSLACGTDKKNRTFNDPTPSYRVLHLTNRDETEEGFRTRLWNMALDNDQDFTSACGEIEGLSPEGAAAILRTRLDVPEAILPIGAKSRPGQRADDADLLRSTQIVLEECRRASQ
jgi:hypothetical protein